MRDMRNDKTFQSEYQKERDNLGDLGVDGMIGLISKCVLKEIGYDGVDWIHVAQDRVQWLVTVTCYCKHSGSMKGGEFIGHLSDY
jgi:hypothetical protein